MSVQIPDPANFIGKKQVRKAVGTKILRVSPAPKPAQRSRADKVVYGVDTAQALVDAFDEQERALNPETGTAKA